MTYTRSIFSKRRVSHMISSDGLGATVVELAIMAPILLAAAGMIIFIAISLSVKASLTSAMLAVRIAQPRSDNISVSMLKGIDSFFEQPGGDLNFVAPYLFSESEIQTYPTATKKDGFYDEKSIEIYGDRVSLSEHPKGVIYAMAYAYKSLRSGYGENLRFPCYEPDCAVCLPLNPATLDTTFVQNPNGTGTPISPLPYTAAFDQEFVGIYCQVIIGGYLKPLIVALQYLLGGNADYFITLREKRFYRGHSAR